MVPPARVELASSAFSEQCTDRLYDSGMVPRTGIEPVTHGLEGRCSVR